MRFDYLDLLLVSESLHEAWILWPIDLNFFIIEKFFFRFPSLCIWYIWNLCIEPSMLLGRIVLRDKLWSRRVEPILETKVVIHWLVIGLEIPHLSLVGHSVHRLSLMWVRFHRPTLNHWHIIGIDLVDNQGWEHNILGISSQIRLLDLAGILYLEWGLLRSWVGHPGNANAVKEPL